MVLYRVTFNGLALSDVSSGKDRQSKKAIFSLTIHGYKPQVTRYWVTGLDLVLAVQGHAYGNFGRPGMSTVTATLTSGGHSGTFIGTHVVPYVGYPVSVVDIHGSWICSRLYP